jgi:hypothetical protein
MARPLLAAAATDPAVREQCYDCPSPAACNDVASRLPLALTATSILSFPPVNCIASAAAARVPTPYRPMAALPPDAAAAGAPHVAVVVHSSSYDPLPLRRCRICFEQDEEEELVDLSCLCKGELARVHSSCGNAWFKRRGAKRSACCRRWARVGRAVGVFTTRKQQPLRGATVTQPLLTPRAPVHTLSQHLRERRV